ncbi:MAG: GNAT family N-acetyltransferase [Mycobacteriales bacterium]
MTSVQHVLPAGYVWSEPDWRTLTEAQLAEGLQLNNALTAEVLPDDPPGTLEDAVRNWKSIPQRMDRCLVRVHDDTGRLVASGGFGLDPDNDDNPDLLFVGINVLAGHRRRGLGSVLLRRLVQLAADRGRTRLVSASNDGVPDGKLFAVAVGAQAKQANHLNHLPVADVDRALLETWLAEGPGRAPGYALEGWDGACPEADLAGFIDAVLVLNTAPRDDLEMNDFTLTPELFREHEGQQEAIGMVSWTLVVRRLSDNSIAGMHDVFWHPSEPEFVWVGATGVRPEDRGHAIGKWLKAAMTLRVLDERPVVTSIRTGNADSNDAMLGINKAMGYRPLLGQTTWEISTADAAAWLASRG